MEKYKEFTSKFSENKALALEFFMHLPNNEKAFVLTHLPKHMQKYILSSVSVFETEKFIRYLDADKITDLLQIAGKKKGDKILELLQNNLKSKVEFLLKFDPNSAAGLMSLDYIEIDVDSNFSELLEEVRKHEKRTGKFPAILAVKENILIGEIPADKLVFRKKSDKIKEYISQISKINYNDKEETIIAKFKENRHSKIVVLDENDGILGVIYTDDILKIIESKASNNLSEFAGLNIEEDVLDSPLKKVKFRYKWLLINLFTSFLAAGVVSLFQETISAFVLLAIYMPIVAGMGGNAATQSLAVVVRGIALKEIELETAKKAVINECIAGLINGIINGIVVAIIATVWNQSFMLGLVIAIAMIVNLVIAGFFGTIIPLFMKKLGKDPATSATIFITTATDVFGFFVFLGLASLFLM